MLFKNYSLIEVTYLLIRFNKTKISQKNTKNTDRNGVNKQNTCVYMHIYITILSGLNQPTAFEENLLQCLNFLQTYYGGFRNLLTFKMKLFATFANG